MPEGCVNMAWVLALAVRRLLRYPSLALRVLGRTFDPSTRRGRIALLALVAACIAYVLRASSS